MNWKPPLTRAGTPCTRCRPHRPCRHHPAPPGRRSVFTPESKMRFLQAAKLGMPITRCCAVAGWERSTFYKWQAESDKGKAPGEILEFFNKELPEAQQFLYTKAMAAIQDGLGPKVDIKDRAAHGLKVITTLYGKDTDPMPEEVRITGSLKAVLEKHRRRRKGTGDEGVGRGLNP